MSAGVTEVGARLSLLNSPAFIRDATAAAEAVAKLTASIDAAAAAGEKQTATNTALADSNVKVAESAGVAKDAVVSSSAAATDANLAASIMSDKAFARRSSETSWVTRMAANW